LPFVEADLRRGRYCTRTSIVLGRDSSDFGSVRVRTPSLYVASIRATSIEFASWNVRLNDPYRFSSRVYPFVLS